MTDKTKVLIAEDDNDDFELFNVALQDLSLSVVITRAENGEILFTLLDVSEPDILFLDLLMPCKDGKTCLREIRANKKYDLLPVVVFSSLTDPHSIEFTFREGANLYVIKPASFSELREVLKRIFSIQWKRSMYYPAFPDFVVNSALGAN